MFTKLILAAAVSSIVPGFATAGHGCDCAATAPSAPVAAAVPAPRAPAVASGTNRSYRTYSYQPNYGGMRSSRPMMRGFSGGVRDAGSKIEGRYGR